MRSLRPKFQNHLVLLLFIIEFSSFGISRSFDLCDLGVLKKSPVNIFNDYIFEICLFHWSKCTMECAICLTLILKSAQARCVIEKCKNFKGNFLYQEMCISVFYKKNPYFVINFYVRMQYNYWSLEIFSTAMNAYFQFCQNLTVLRLFPALQIYTVFSCVHFPLQSCCTVYIFYHIQSNVEITLKKL